VVKSGFTILFRAFMRLVLRIFFRGVEVVGAERLPLGRPMVLVANHVNGLIDAVIFLGALPVFPRTLAKSTLWDNPAVWPFLSLAGSIPVYRHQDKVDTAQNEETFRLCRELLAGGGALALFPEGKSHSEPALQPLKTGIARIVLGAESGHPGLGTRILPVGFTFDAKETFRSRVLLQIGEPIDPAPELAQGGIHGPNGPDAVRALTARVSDALEKVTLNYASWEDSHLVARAAELWGREEVELPGRRDLAEAFPIQRAVIEGSGELRRHFPDRVAAVAEAVRDYDRLLHALHLRDDQVAAAYPVSPVVRFVLAALLRLLVHLPLAVAGTILNWVPYRLIGILATRFAAGSTDQTATNKLFGAVLLFPLTWTAAALLAARWTGSWWAVPAVLLAAPLAGYAALLFDEQRETFWREARAYLLLRTRKRSAAELRGKRREVLQQMGELEDLWRGLTH
jgi:1-acyl-sn-glycerol-3-phosphate acyltransferase